MIERDPKRRITLDQLIAELEAEIVEMIDLEPK